MREEFLHFIWKNRLFGTEHLYTREGRTLVVIDPGDYNRNAGPDFFNSRLRVGETIWAGNVEVHINASDWYSHRHHLDHAYDNVILHVVANYDAAVESAGGTVPDTFIISWEARVEEKYNEYLNNPDIIACRNDLDKIPGFTQRHCISRMAAERLEVKTRRIKETLNSTNNDWDETLYRLLAKYFGMKVNAGPFYLLSLNLPLRIIRRHADKRLQVEALMYGQAGMLEPGAFDREIYDEYYCSLLAEYRLLRQKYSLKPAESWMWKFHRLRPLNFPTIRISQLAGIMSTGRSLFGMMKSCAGTAELREVFTSAASAYWNDHYIFGSYKKGKEKRTGSMMVNMLLINTIIPMLYYLWQGDRQG
ncbi:MAG: DUF2851 family protein [Bacteroidales bacterium]|nr:DUF2851 family protein [Bacteroidales bacterium]